MGKKVKTGKSRRDKYYELAKETGYRARSAFKLLQLNSKFHFLENARVCVDLCAAPGGWLQVAQQHMPMSSQIIGVDLVPIKPIRNVITLQEDITTEKCRAAIRKEVQTWDVDVVLHDGAPNVGKNWIHDAFSQAQLTLQALKLAIGILRKGGWFVTKVFRSSDYNSLIYVFRQLFKKVFATKPKASRNESAEIFVVCQHFVKPDKIDSKFTDPKFVFKEIANDGGGAIDLRRPEKRNKKADGYDDGDYTQYHPLSVLEFLATSNHLEKLARASEIVLDDPRIRSHPLTTDEIRECCSDIKVLGKREIRLVLNWRKKLKDLVKSTRRKSQSAPSSDEEDSDNEEAAEKEEERGGMEEDLVNSEDEEANEEIEIDEQLKSLKDEEEREAKKKLKRVRREKAKFQKKLELKMVLPGDHIDVTEDSDLFKLKSIHNKQELSAVEEVDLEDIDEALSDDDDDHVDRRPSRAAFDRNEPHDYGFSSDDQSDDDDDMSDGWDDAKETPATTKEKKNNTNPRLVQLEDEKTKSERNANIWFKKDTFGLVNEDEDEDMEIGLTLKQHKNKGGAVLEKEKTKKKKEKGSTNKDDKEIQPTNGTTEESASTQKHIETVKDHMDSDLSDSSDLSESSDSESENETEVADMDTGVSRRGKTMLNNSSKDGFEVVPASHPVKKQKLDAEGLAIGAALAESRKRRRQIIESAYNRFTFDDQSLSLPDWFVKDETRHSQAQLPVTRDEVQLYKQRELGIDARPIKKVAEAKARKKRKMMKRLEKARKKAEAISDNVDVTDREKMQQIKNIYKKAGLLKKQQKKEVTYVVAKKGLGKKVSRPAGVKGRFKMVDPRMKKEVRKNKELDKKRSGKKKKK